jgi:hypothetical protein
MGEGEIVRFERCVAGEAGLVQGLVGRLAVVELREPPASAPSEPRNDSAVREWELPLSGTRDEPDSSRLRVVVAPCATHTHAAWAARLPAALTFLYAPR